MNDTFVWDLNASNTVCLGAQLDRWNDVPVMTDKPSFFSKKKIAICRHEFQSGELRSVCIYIETSSYCLIRHVLLLIMGSFELYV
jgi:hypothetical protein